MNSNEHNNDDVGLDGNKGGGGNSNDDVAQGGDEGGDEDSNEDSVDSDERDEDSLEYAHLEPYQCEWCEQYLDPPDICDCVLEIERIERRRERRMIRRRENGYEDTEDDSGNDDGEYSEDSDDDDCVGVCDDEGV